MQKLVLFVLIQAIVLDSFPQEVNQVVLERTEVISFHSDIAGKDYELFISLPMGYQSNDTVSYPLIIQTDAYRSFSIVKGITDVFTTPGTLIPKVIIVGIGYGGKGTDALLKWALGRTYDLTPINLEDVNSNMELSFKNMGIKGVKVKTGGAQTFLNFIKSELLPFIESNYRINNSNKLLSGYSFGGDFGLYVLFKEPGLFEKYLIGSPGVHFGDGIIYKYEEEYHKSHTELNAKVFISVGGLEPYNYPEFKKITNIIKSRNYDKLILETHVFEDEDHYSAAPGTYSRGLLKLYKE